MNSFKHMLTYLFFFFSSSVYSFVPSSSTRISNANANTITNHISHPQLQTQKYNLIQVLSSVINNFGKTAEASHIVIKPRSMSQSEAKEKLTQLKAEINNDPIKFAQYAREYSDCVTAKDGGVLGEFGPGRMVVNFDRVCFEEEVGVVHGPVSTQFGEHLILITKRTGDKE